VRFETVCLLLALSVLKDWHISGLNVCNAYLYGKLDKEIYMERPEGFKVQGQELKVYRLCRALYELKQAGLVWWQTMSKSLKDLGFSPMNSDAGVYIYEQGNAAFTIAVVYVDDALFFGPDKALNLELKQKFMEKWECCDL
jgi:hypothetical protein